MKHEEKCYFCHGGPVVKTKIDHYRHINGRLAEIKGVPCGVCQQCGEKYISMLKQLDALRKSLSIRQKSISKYLYIVTLKCDS